MKRSISLDLLKLFLCIIVVAGHLYPLFEIGSKLGWFIINGYARNLVPFFLIINGYFLAKKIDDNKSVGKYLKHLIIVYVVWMLVYLKSYYWQSAPRIILHFIEGYHHLWYLPALMEGVIILFLLKKWIKNDYILVGIGTILYLIGNQINTYSSFEPISKNGIFYGYFYITLGYVIKKYSIEKKISSPILAIGVILGLITIYFEASYYYTLDIAQNLFISSMFMAPCGIMLLLKNPWSVNQNTFTYYLGYIPTGVYYIHLLFVYQFYRAEYNIYQLPIVFGLSVLATIPLIYINKKVKYIF